MAILANVGNPISVTELGDTQAAARALNLEFDTLEIAQADDITLLLISKYEEHSSQDFS